MSHGSLDWATRFGRTCWAFVPRPAIPACTEEAQRHTLRNHSAVRICAIVLSEVLRFVSRIIQPALKSSQPESRLVRYFQPAAQDNGMASAPICREVCGSSDAELAFLVFGLHLVLGASRSTSHVGGRLFAQDTRPLASRDQRP